jgi:hypothetical protein
MADQKITVCSNESKTNRQSSLYQLVFGTSSLGLGLRLTGNIRLHCGLHPRATGSTIRECQPTPVPDLRRARSAAEPAAQVRSTQARAPGTTITITSLA